MPPTGPFDGAMYRQLTAVDPYMDTPDDFVVEWSRARGVKLQDATSLLCKSPGGREPALAALTGARLFAVRARIRGDAFDAPHVFFFDAERRHLMTNWHTSRVVEFDDDDATSVQAARLADVPCCSSNMFVLSRGVENTLVLMGVWMRFTPRHAMRSWHIFSDCAHFFGLYKPANAVWRSTGTSSRAELWNVCARRADASTDGDAS